MKKQNDQQLNENKSDAPALKYTNPTTSRLIAREGGEGSTSSDGALEHIRARAYRLFEMRGQQPGHALDDWLQAEREILRPSASPRAAVSRAIFTQ